MGFCPFFDDKLEFSGIFEKFEKLDPQSQYTDFWDLKIDKKLSILNFSPKVLRIMKN